MPFATTIKRRFDAKIQPILTLAQTQTLKEEQRGFDEHGEIVIAGIQPELILAQIQTLKEETK